jgi:GNAT superfamily N-acetyltransferase
VLPTDALEAIAVALGEPKNSVRLMPETGIFNAVADATHRAGRRSLPVVLGALHANRARELYRRLGFQEVGSTDTHTLYSRPSLRLRPAGPADGRAAAEIYVVSSNAAFADFQPPKELTKERIARWEVALARPGCHWWLAEVADSLVGPAGVGPSRDPVQAGVGELDTIAVVPDRWRQGIEKGLMTLANEQLDRDGFGRAVLWTWADYPAAAAFYPKVGWHPTSGRRDQGRQMCYERGRAQR